MTVTKIKVAHIADCHLRAYQYGSSRRGRAFLQGVENAISAAAKAGANMILCSGDLLDSNNPGPEVAINQLMELNEYLLVEHYLPMFVSVGNHDNCEPSWLTPYEYTDTDGEVGAGLFLLRPDEVNGGEFFFQKDTWPFPLKVGVSSYMPANLMREELQYYTDLKSKFDIYMWHGEIREFCGYPKEDAICIDDFPKGMASVIAMGDQHVHKYIRRSTDDMVIAYPGSTEMCSESEDEHKKLLLYTFAVEGDNYVLENIESVPFETQPVIRRTLRTEEELNETVQYIQNNPDVLAYIRYDRTLHEAVSRLQDAADKNLTCLRLTPMMPDRFNVHTMSREAVKYGPVEFFEANKTDLIHDPEVLNRVDELCKDLLTANKEHKVSINKFCNDRLGTTCL